MANGYFMSSWSCQRDIDACCRSTYHDRQMLVRLLRPFITELSSTWHSPLCDRSWKLSENSNQPLIAVISLKVATFVVYSINVTGRGCGTRAGDLSVDHVSTSTAGCLDSCIATVTLSTEGLE